MLRTNAPWKLFRLSSGRYSLENYKLDANALHEVLSFLEKSLGKRVQFNCKFGLDLALAAAAVELLIDGERITLGYDIWSGVFIMALDEGGDCIIKKSIAPLFYDVV